MKWPWSKPAPFLPVDYVPYVPPETTLEPPAPAKPKPDAVEAERGRVVERVRSVYGLPPDLAERASREITAKALEYFGRIPPRVEPVEAPDPPGFG